jgi:hypothetical protein
VVTWASSAFHPRTCSTGTDEHAPHAASASLPLAGIDSESVLRLAFAAYGWRTAVTALATRIPAVVAYRCMAVATCMHAGCACWSMYRHHLHARDTCVLLSAAVGSCQSCGLCSSCVPVTTPRVYLWLPSSSTTRVHSSGSTLDHGRWAQPGPHYSIIVCQLGPHRVCNHQFSSVMGMG